MSERTGYATGRVTGKRDGHPLLCSVMYDVVAIVGEPVVGNPRSLDCDLPDGHDGDHWDRAWGLEWKSESVSRDAWDAVSRNLWDAVK